MDRHTEILSPQILAPRLLWPVAGLVLAALPWMLTLRRPHSPPEQPAGIEADMVDAPRPWPRSVWSAPERSHRVSPIAREVHLEPVPAAVAAQAAHSAPAESAGSTRRPRLPLPPIDVRTTAVLRTGFPAVAGEVLDGQSAFVSNKTDRSLSDVHKQGARQNEFRPGASAADDAQAGAAARAADSVNNPPLALRGAAGGRSAPPSDESGEALRHGAELGEATTSLPNPQGLLDTAGEVTPQGPRLLTPGTPLDEPWPGQAPAEQPRLPDAPHAPLSPPPQSEPVLPGVDAPGVDALDVGSPGVDALDVGSPGADSPGRAPAGQSPRDGAGPEPLAPEPVAPQGPQLDSPAHAPRTILQPAASPLVPGAAIAGHSAEMERISRQADQQTRKGFELAGHRAYFAARARFIGALRLMAQGLDMEHQTKAHSHALAAGLRAMKEAEDFLPQAGQLEADLDIPAIVAGHETPVLRDVANDRLSCYSALRCYLTFAQEQLAAAGGSEVASSMALHGLGKLHAALSDDRAAPIGACEPKAVAFFQAALLVFPGNFMAANDLAVLLARREDYVHARVLLEHSLSICAQTTGWHNLAVVYERLGFVDLARRAERLAQVWHNAELAHRGGRPAELPMIQWVDPATFARYQTDFPGTGPPSRSIGPAASAPSDTSAAAQPGRPPAGSHFARRPPDGESSPPNRR